MDFGFVDVISLIVSLPKNMLKSLINPWYL